MCFKKKLKDSDIHKVRYSIKLKNGTTVNVYGMGPKDETTD